MADKTFQDEVDQTNIDQLHKAVLQLSNNCFELKKFCVTVLISGITLIAVFTNHRLDPFIFVAAICVVIFFWTLDGQSYYYQEKIRARMKEVATGLATRRTPPLAIDGVGMPLAIGRAARKPPERILASLFNWSMIFYPILAVTLTILALLYSHGYLHSYPMGQNP